MKLTSRVVLAVIIAACFACGDERNSSTDMPLRVGQLIGGTGPYPGAMAGVYFRTATQSGYTAADGSFRYRDGEMITFGVADVAFPPLAGAPLISPWQLAGEGRCEQRAGLELLLMLLYSLDGDGDLDNGVAIEPVAAHLSWRLANLTDDDLATLVERLIPGRVLVDPSDAVERFITQMDSELWEQIGRDEFPLAVGLARSQGVATDGSSWFFSWQLGLERTALDYGVELSARTAIPPEVAALGGNHIGDIDYWDGTLYAPVEDGRAYLHPHLVLYDPTTLTPIRIHALDDVPLPDGVPWVAVDGPRNQIYVAVWDPTPEIFVLDLATLEFKATIPLRRTLHRIQGAKVFEGSLYASTDNDDKSIFKIDLETGTVIELFGLHQDFEEEGLVFLERPDGSLLHTLNVQNPVRGTELRHHRRTRAPLRQAVCGE